MMRINNTGMKELDVILNGYIAGKLDMMGYNETNDLHALLDVDTPDLYQAFVLMKGMPEQLKENSVAADLLNYTTNITNLSDE